MMPQITAGALLAVENLRVACPVDGALTEVVRGVDLSIAPGEALGLVGESGSGKSMTAMALMQLVVAPACITAGRAVFEGVDLLAIDERAMRQRRGREISMVFQDP